MERKSMGMTGGQLLAQQLEREGVTEVFSVPGVQLDWAVEAIRQLGPRMRYIVQRHEQATSYMADGYARTTGRIGVCMVVPGPGLLNAMSGLATAYGCNSPVLCIAGGIHSGAVGKGLGLLHEVNNQSDILGAVTKWHALVKRTEDIPALVREACGRLRTGRPRPVGLEIPPDLLSASSDAALIHPPADHDGRTRPQTGHIAQAARMLESARLPVIYVGGGVLAAGASEALERVADKLQAPVVMSDNGQGALSDRHPLALSTLAGRAVFPHADVVLVVGSRFVDSLTPVPQWSADRIRYIFMNADPADWGPPRSPALAIHADARLGLEALDAELHGQSPSRAADMKQVRAWAEEQCRDIEPQVAWVRALRAAIPEDGILVNELTQVGYVARLAYPVYRPRTILSPGYQGTLGSGYPTALGVAVGNPGRPVVSLNGDGGFGWGLQELATARKHDLGVVAIVFNDGYFGNVRTIQEHLFGHTIGVKLHNPDFVALAGAFGIPGVSVDSPAALESELRSAIAAGGPHLIEARLGEVPSPWHLLRLRASLGRRPSPEPPNPLGSPP